MFRYNSFLLEYHILYYKIYILNIMFKKLVNGSITFRDYYDNYNYHFIELIKFHNWMCGYGY